MNPWVVVLVVGAASFAIRATPLLASSVIALRPRMREGLQHAGIGAMAALLVTALAPHGRTGPPDVGIVLALAVGAVLAWRRRSMAFVVAVGAGVYLVAAGVQRLL